MKLKSLNLILWLYKAFRGIFVAIVAAAIVLPVAAYVILSSDWVLGKICEVADRELTTLFGTEVEIGGAEFSPFNRLKVKDITIEDDFGAKALKVASLETRFEVWDLILRGKVIVDYAMVEGLDLKLYKDSVDAPLNIDQIIKRLNRPKPDNTTSSYRLRLNDVSLVDCRLSYDVLNAPETPGRFCPQHISVNNINLSAFAPLVSNDDYRLRLRTLNFEEQSGFTLVNLTLNGQLTERKLQVDNLTIQLPESQISLADMTCPIDSIKAISEIAKHQPVGIGIKEGTHLYLPDIKAFVPILEKLDYDIDITMAASVTRDSVDLETLEIADPSGIFKLNASGAASGLASLDSMRFDNLAFNLSTDTLSISRVLGATGIKIAPHARKILGSIGHTTINGKIDGMLADGMLHAAVNSPLARVKADCRFMRRGAADRYGLKASAQIDSLRLGLLTGNADLNRVKGKANVDGEITGKKFAGDVELNIDAIDFKGYRYKDIAASATLQPTRTTADLRISDPNISAIATGEYITGEELKNIGLSLAFKNINLDTLNLNKAYPGHALSGTLSAHAEAKTIDKFRGNLEMSNLAFVNAKGEGIRLRNFEILADNLGKSGRISIVSDVINGVVDGEYKFTTLGSDFKNLISDILPALIKTTRDNEEAAAMSENNFAYDLTINPCEDICHFFKLPVAIVNPLVINGYFRGEHGTFHLMCDTKWLAKGDNSYIEDPDVMVDLNSHTKVGNVFMECTMPTQKGMMEVSAKVEAFNGALDTNILWTLVREKPINGTIAFLTLFSRDEQDQLMTEIDFNPGKLNFGNEIWNIHMAQIIYAHDKATIRDFALVTEEGVERGPSLQSNRSLLASFDNDNQQSVRINGTLGVNPDDELTVDLRNIQLINIFETLDIDNALISGFATGTVKGNALLSKNPVIECERMQIESIGYNYCTIGDAVAKLSFDEGGTIFNFTADVTQPQGRHSTLSGFIKPATEELNLDIRADHVNVGFMKPFMKAFTSDVKGYASGYANLYGTFHDIDLVGDIYADSLAIKLDFTNTWYYASDSIHIRPGIIDLTNIMIRDEYGHAAMLNGWVGHKYFHEAFFEFNVTDARNFLCYDVGEKQSPIWYGRIFGNGGVTVKGHPGIVDIKARITTEENTAFTFVLSDQEEANEYTFITFRDVTPKAPTDSILDKNTIPETIRRVLDRNNSGSDDEPTNYVMDLEVIATPKALLTIVMDPVGGDKITAHGSGNMRMQYTSVDNDIRLYGKYTLERGDYNFTLQDIIRKEFTITQGSAINFSGDPYRAELDINAYATINANLSDLDESFLQDKELTRTTVPVRAMLLVRGDMMQPSISFDLEFPTLKEDTYRKVKSIVSTEDMMSTQIIYLLALGRFYTPEYMASTTKGNELFSVASTTLASQLSNMLGKLADNWSIAPNLRSDRGDFSDIEVDLTLSSSLLNNRLLFNGNFGYREKSMNTNQFVGDFDIEYLLNNSGEWRLKAYNRYNDQNYYLRTAQTTQGIGVVYRRDFDKTLRFLKNLRFWEKKNENDNDSIKSTTLEP